MDSSDIGKIILVVGMMVFSALFSGTETAYSSVNKLRLKNYEAQGNKNASKALKLANRFDDVLTAVLIGNNIVNIATSAVATVLFCSWFGNSSGPAVSTAVVTVLVLIFCEVLPKSYAKRNPEKIALLFASPLTCLVMVLKPFVYILNKMSSVFKDNEAPSVTEDELKYMIDEIEEEGVIEEQESELMKNALDFDEITVNEILIPRVKVIGIENTADVEEIKNIFGNEMYSRLPVYEKSLDNIIGIITNKSFFKMLVEGKNDISGIIQEVPHIADTKLISEALRLMKKAKVHLAVVTDQYGGTKGIITLEDIIEELVGEIYDESDEIITNIVKLSDNRYEISGDTSISDMLEHFELDENLIDTDYTTVGGWVTDIMGYIPEADEFAETEMFRITTTEVNENKVEKVIIELIEKNETKE